MKTKLFPLILALAFSGCEAPQSRTSTYKAAEYARYAGTGTAKITGQAFLKTVGGDVKYAAGNRVWLYPATSMTTEWYEKVIKGGHPLKAGDERMMQHSKMTLGDGTGNFEFDSVVAGDYYVVSQVSWGVPNGYFVNYTGGAVHAKVHVNDGEMKRVILTAQ